MSELRQNIATKEWVIIASERARRPNSYAEPGDRILSEELPEYDAGCPFCPGNEEHDLEVESIPELSNWQTRVVRNKYPALMHEGMPDRFSNGVRRRIHGVGYHEVVVLHPKHNMTIALMRPWEVSMAFATMQRRARVMANDPRIEQIVIFKNHGQRAGASLLHPHCQIIALPVVPSNIRSRLEEARRYFDDNGHCIFRAILEDELDSGERIVAMNEHFVAFVLYASASPFHMWIIPRQHRASFQDASDEEIASLGEIMQNVLNRVYVGLRDPDYNFMIRSAPIRDSRSISFHWYISLVLRLSRVAGFELGSGMYINPTVPEVCAAFLRDLA
ncbi:MAG: galactose-1-phosphate uridylyltransferase [Chloroflexaceae bacterium]|nr:galactose-1-phosphate uridylyltransferase [Chloroflexaceae bacterium]